MAKKIKFPLVMKDGAEARTMEEFKAHFDIEKAVGYFLDGKLLAWLEARYYDTEADAVRALDKNDAELRKKLCGIFGAEYDEAETPALDMEEAQERSRKLAKLRQYTSDQAILDKVDSVAFDQEDLADLLDNDVHDIYLCNNSFVIPLRVENKKYIGIGKAEAVIKSEEWVDFAAKKIVYENVEFDAAYEKVYAESAEGLFALGRNANFRLNDYNLAAEYYQKSFEKGSEYALLSLAELYEFTGDKNFRDMGKAIYWYTKMADAGDPYGMVKLAELYATGGKERKAQKYIEVDEEKARYWLEKAAETGEPFGMFALADHLKDGTYGCEKNFQKAFLWYIKCANTGNPSLISFIGDLYAGGKVENSPLSDVATALLWYEKALASNRIGSYLKSHVWCSIGDLYAKGGFGEQEREKSLPWYQKALDSGFVSADMDVKNAEGGVDIDKMLKWHKINSRILEWSV